MSTDLEPIGERLKRLRLLRRLSQRELAVPGVSYAYISRIESGSRQPSAKALRKLAPQLGVSPEYLEFGEAAPDSTRICRLAVVALKRLEEGSERRAMRHLERLVDELRVEC